ncbi:hypothetical protein ATANTOWER_002211, partial [Ataeniobius toweri]|nr:hypothetical protein [Ataeniobius toweri]
VFLYPFKLSVCHCSPLDSILFSSIFVSTLHLLVSSYHAYSSKLTCCIFSPSDSPLILAYIVPVTLLMCLVQVSSVPSAARNVCKCK